MASSTKGPCPECDSSDAFARFTTGEGHCFSCEYHEFLTDSAGRVTYTKEPWTRRLEMTGTVAAIPERRISQETCKQFNVTVEYNTEGTISKHHYPYYSVDTGEIVATKVKTVEGKQFYVTGDIQQAGLFGQQKCSGRGKYLTITEGELDQLAVSEMFARKWDVVSLRNGAAAARKDLVEQLEWLEGYEFVVLCMDNDKAGQAAVDAVKDLFSPGKLKICKLPRKDAGDMLKHNEVQLFTKAWWDSPVYRPDGIVAGVDTWEAITENRNVHSIPYPWLGLNTLTRGFRLGELVTITSGSGMGKSQFIREIEHYIQHATEDNIGVIALEETIARTALGIMSVAANRPLHLEEDTPAEQLRPFWEQTLGSGRYFLFDHWGSTGEDNLLARVRYMAKALDCRWIVLDHLSIVVSSQDSGDERKAIDAIMTKLRTLVAELGVGLFLVSHLKRSGGTAHEDGGKISLSELRGSQAIAQLSDMVLGLERSQQHEDPEVRNTSTVRVLKNRYTGQTGPACYLRYDTTTGRMVECAKPTAEAGKLEKEF